MLRISEGVTGNGSATLRLEGHVVGPWVGELQRSCEEFLGKGYQLTLDLGEVSFVDRDGLAILRDLKGGRAALVNCPLFLSEQLKASESSTPGSALGVE